MNNNRIDRFIKSMNEESMTVEEHQGLNEDFKNRSTIQKAIEVALAGLVAGIVIGLIYLILS